MVVPEVDSYVLVGLIENRKESAFICAFGKVKKIKLITEDIELGGANFGGLTKTPELVTQLNKNNDLLTAMLSIINGAPILEPGNGSPSALQTSLKSALTGKSLGDFSNLENEKVKHG